jgi:hypothetical protein
VVLTALGVLGLGVTAWAADQVVIEDWSTQPLGVRGIPGGWKGQNWGSAAYDLTVVENDRHRVLHLKSQNEGSTVAKEIKGLVDLNETPILEWQWKVTILPAGGDARRKERDDEAAQIFLVWPRFPEAVRSRIIGYIWDTTAPKGAVFKSEKTGTVTYIVLRSGPAELGRWVTERRNVREDFKQVYGEEPEGPGVLAISIDTNDTRSTAESFVGPIVFKRP